METEEAQVLAPVESAPATEPTFLALPNSYSPDLAQQWLATPHEMRSQVTKRELDAQRKITELGQKAARFDPVAQVFDRYRPHVAELAHLEPHAVAEHLLAAHHMLATNPSRGIQHLLQAYKVDPSSLIPDAIRQQLGSGHAAVQQVTRLEAQVKDLEQRLQLEGKRKASTDAQRAARINVRSSADVRGQTPKTMNDTLTEIASRHYGH